MLYRMKNRLSIRRHSGLVLMVCLIFAVSTGVQAVELVVMKVFLNAIDKGEQFFSLTTKGGVFFSPELVSEIGITNLPQDIVINEQGDILLQSISPSMDINVDTRAATLHIKASSKFFHRQVIDLGLSKPVKVVYPQNNTAFINYSIDYQESENGDSSLSLPMELGVSFDNWLAYSAHIYSKNNMGETSVRLMSNLTWDDPRKLRRFVMGDFSAFSGNLGSGGIFGGLSFSKNFSVDPYFVKTPDFSVAGVLEMPSDVELYINNMLVTREQFLPGKFEFLNPPNAIGAGNATLVIKDVFGRERKIEEPFYTSYQLLKPGLHEYSYNIGRKRENFGDEFSRYTDWAFIGFHRTGLTDALTVGARAEADRELMNAGVDAKFLLGTIGEAEVSLASSRNNLNSGRGGMLGLFFSGQNLTARIFARALSRDYATLSMDSLQDKSKLERFIGLGYRRPALGSIAVAFSNVDKYVETDSRRAMIFYTRRMSKRLSLYLRASRTQTDQILDEAFVGLNFSFGTGGSGGAQYNSQNEKVAETLYLNQNPPVDTGSSYKISLNKYSDRLADIAYTGAASIQYRGRNAIYEANYRDGFEEKNYGLRVAGGIAMIDDSLYLSRPILDSFALVKIGGLAGVRVQHNNQSVGRTNNEGEVLIPGLISYYYNNLSIDDQDIPVNYRIPKLKQYAFTPFRGGGVVEFEVTKLQGFIGRLYATGDGRKIPAEYWGLEVQTGDRTVSTIVGKEGEFYLENMPSGKLEARVFSKNRECRFDLVIPKSDEIMVYLDEVACETN